MAELTYDPTPADQPEFSPEEQESLEIGERLAQEEANLLAGKYENAEELEKAYLELQGKLGEPRDEEAESDDEEPEGVEDEFLDMLWQQSQEGEFSEELLAQLEDMDASDVADMFLEYRQSVEEGTATDMSAEDVTGLQNLVGGEEAYGEMIGWAQANLAEEEINMFDSVMDRGDPVAAYFAIQALALRYGDANGVEGELLTGTTPSQAADVFRSQAEVVQAMNDPRYDKDPAYRQDVYDKLDRSNIQF